MSTALLVDTNVLYQGALRDLLTAKIKGNLLHVYVPTLAHAERIRQIADLKGEQFALHVIQQLVEESRFELLPFSVEDAEAVAQVWLALKDRGATENDWKQNRLDILLCAVAQSRGYTLITDDTGQHFDVVTSRMKTTDLREWLEQI
jgi:predicted nucleic acid-binding protein